VDLMLEASAFLPVDSIHKRVSSPEPVALSPLRPMPLLPSAAAKLRFAVPVDRSAGD
jgi:hypothetical protein